LVATTLVVDGGVRGEIGLETDDPDQGCESPG